MKIQIKVGVHEIEVYFKIHIVTYFFINMKCDEFIQLKYSPLFPLHIQRFMAPPMEGGAEIETDLCRGTPRMNTVTMTCMPHVAMGRHRSR